MRPFFGKIKKIPIYGNIKTIKELKKPIVIVLNKDMDTNQL